MKENELSKEDESKPKDDDKMYNEPLKHFEANFTPSTLNPSRSPAEYSGPVPCSHSQAPGATGDTEATYQPLLPPRQPKDAPPSASIYQSLGPPALYAVPQVSGEVSVTRNDVPRPAIGGLSGVRGKPLNEDRI